MTGPDAAFADAEKALAGRARALIQAVLDGEDHPDPEGFAAEFTAWLRTQGWWPAGIRAAADWRLRGTGEPGRSEETRSALEAARAKCAVSPTRVHPAGPPDNAA